MYDGKSSVMHHGPASAVAPSRPLLAAVCAASARALSGRPSTSALSSMNFSKALVLSSTLLENLVLSLALSCCSLLNSSLASPVSATPLSSALRISESTMRRCASVSAS